MSGVYRRNIAIKLCRSHSAADKTQAKEEYAVSFTCPKYSFSHDRPWISPWIKSISNELDIIIHVIAPQLSGHCDGISNRLWRHQQSENWASETRGRCVKIGVLLSFMDSLCRVRNKIMYVLSWRTVSVLTRVSFWCSFSSGTREINTKITLSSALKQFVTRVHISFYIYVMFGEKYIIYYWIDTLWLKINMYRDYTRQVWMYTQAYV